MPIAVRPARPARVDQPDLRVVGADFVGQQGRVFVRMPDHEGRAKASRKRGLWLGDAHLGASDFGRVSAHKVIHGLVGRQAADWRQHAEGIAGEEDDVAWMATCAGDHRVGNVVDGIGRAGVFGDRVVVVIDPAVLLVADDVFQDRAKADGAKDLRLLLWGQVDAFGIAAALDVEDSLRAPDVLVVADQLPLGIGRERGLARARQAKEQRSVAASSRIGRTVHGQQAGFGHEEVHHCEHALFHFARVLGSQNHHFPALEAQVNAGRGSHLRSVAVGRKAAGIVDGKIRRLKLVQFGFGRADEHVVHEERVVCPGANHADFEPILGIPAGESIDYVQLLAGVEIVDGAL